MSCWKQAKYLHRLGAGRPVKRRYECFGEQATAQKKKHENKFAQDVIVQDTI
ncbi:unnamed protein product, partial [Brassica rapa]